MSDIAISIVIPTYNGVEVLPDQIDALIPQIPTESELILSDNGSSDALDSLAGRYSDRCRIRIVDSSERRGNAAARNIGAAAAAGDILLFLDQDDEVADGWLDELLSATKQSGLAVGSLPICANWMRRHSVSTQAQSRLLGTYDYLPFGMSSNMGLSRAAFEELGGFDERFAAATDVDLCWRAQEAGMTIAWCDRAVVRKRTKSAGAFAQHRSYGRDDVLLYQRHRASGMRRSAGLGRRLAWLVTRVVVLHRRPVRAAWVRAAGRLVGRFQGSIRSGCLYL